MSLPPSAQGSIAGGVAFPLPVRESHPLEAPSLAWRAEVGTDIQLKNILGRPAANHPAYLVQRVVCTSSRPEAGGAVEKVLLEDRVEQFHRGPLHDLVFKGGDRDRPLSPILLVDVDPAQRLCAVGLALQLFVQFDKILN